MGWSAGSIKVFGLPAHNIIVKPKNKVIVIGSGFGGIASALRFRAKGYDVTVLERNHQLGGRALTIEKEGFRHDGGPTVITAPFLLSELFELFSERLEDHIQLIELSPWYRYVFQNGDHFNYGGSLDDTLREIRRFNPLDAEGYQRMVLQSKAIFEVGFTELSTRSFEKFSTLIAQIPKLLKLKSYQSTWDFVSSYLKDPRLRRAFSIQPLLVGGNPFQTTSIYSLIHYLERAWGVHFAMGGTGAIIQALRALMERHAIDIRLGETVQEITFQGKCASGVLLASGETLSADIVVANADALHLYQHMVPTPKQSLQTRLNVRYGTLSMGLFVLYFGTTRTYPEVAHHTIWMGQRFRSLLHDIFDRKILSDDFSLYVHRPTATDPSFAPPGCDSFYVLCPVPNLESGIDWALEGPRLRDRIVNALDETLLPELKTTITAEFFRTPKTFEQELLSYKGTGFSLAPVFSQSAYFRFHNKAEGLENLYLVGAGTHPGAGLPGVLCSAKVVDSYIPNLTSS